MLSVAVKLLLRDMERTAVTVLMLVPVVALLISSSMVTSGFLQQATASVGLVHPSDQYLAYAAGSPTPSASSLGYSALASIEQGGASSALPVLSFPASVADGGRTAKASVLATNMTSFVVDRGSDVYGHLAVGGSQADAGAVLAKILGIRVGDSVTVGASSGAQTLTVVGILNSTDQSDTGLILPLSTSWSLWPQTAHEISYVEFDAQSPAASPKVPEGMTVIREQGIVQIASSLDDQTSSLLRNWTYVLFALSAAAAIAAASRVVTGVSQEYDIVRALGGSLPTARKLVFYELLMVSGVAVLIGVAAGIVATSLLGTLFKAADGLPLAPSIDAVQVAEVGTAAFLLILGAGSVSLAWLPKRIGGTGEA